MFNPIVEVFSEPENTTSNLPWKYSVRADTIFRFYAQLRMQLFPYIYSYALRSRIEGKHMIGKFPDHVYQYTFGDELLVAPVYEKGATAQKVFLPEGKWINYWTGEAMKGTEEHSVAAPIYQVPLFVKQGAIIPMRNYASSIEKGNNNTLLLHVYPGANGSFNLLEDDGTSNDYLNGIYASTIIELKNSPGKFVLTINPLQGKYSGMSPTRNWILNIHSGESPKQISLNRKSLKFRYDKVNKIAIVETSQLQVKKLLDFEVSY
jgi:alpha-glucosidase (family GH31 glycosyl hydrolase)